MSLFAALLTNCKKAPATQFSFQVRFLKRPPINTTQLTSGRRVGALAMKVGMLSIYDKWGVRHAVTILQLDDCRVTQFISKYLDTTLFQYTSPDVKTIENEGYVAMQLGVGEAKLKRVKLTALRHFERAGVVPKRKLMEFKVTPDALLTLGSQIRAQHFVAGQLVDVCGTSKGKGFQGVMKRWNFGGGRASHGNSLSHRVVGSTGCRQDPGRVFKNKKMPGRMGNERVTVQNLKVLKIDPSRELVYVKGAVPGQNGNFVRIVDAVKGPFYPSPPPFPTYQTPADIDPEKANEPIFAPVSEFDVGKLSEPVNPI